MRTQGMAASQWGMITTMLLVMIVGATTAVAQGRGDGGIVVREGASVYVKSTGEKVEITLNRGEAVAGITTQGIFGETYQFEEDEGRVHVLYFRPGVSEGVYYTAWMAPEDLARFTYDCGCDHETKPRCRPTSTKWMKFRWNTCFLEARDTKLAQLRATWGQTTTSPGAAIGPSSTVLPTNHAASTPAEKPLTNDDVISLVKLDLGDDIVIAKIQQAPAEALDVSTDGLVRLKQAGIGKAVIDAMLKRAAQRK